MLRFYERRARRILPALFFVIAACIPFVFMWMLPDQIMDLSKSIMATSLFVSNIYFWRSSGYFSASSDEKPLLHTWSLAVEEQYYILFPVFLMLSWRYGKNTIFWLLVAVTSASLLLSEFSSKYYPVLNYYLTPTRAWEILAGSISAFIIHKHGKKSNYYLPVIGCAAILYSLVFFNEKTPFPSFYTLIPVIGACLIILYANEKESIGRVLSSRVLVFVGLISYSLYLWHQPVFAFSKITTIKEHSSIMSTFLIALVFLLSFCTYKFVEQPFRKSNQKNTKRTVIISGLSIIVILGGGI